jgi:hypothetical protein
MQPKYIQSVGIALTLLYATFIVWIYVTAPASLAEVATQTRAATGTYEVDPKHFEAALQLFRADQFRAAREEWALADPLQRDARTQFYVAYSFYREGWGRTYNDDTLFKQGLDAVNRAIGLSNGVLSVDDSNLKMHTAAELKSELRQGLERSWSDLNPLKVLGERK